MGHLMRRSLVVVAVLCGLLPARADAAWPGGNGMIAFVCGGICVVNADGTGARRMPLPPDSAGGATAPAWSPDGNHLVFGASTEDTFPFEDIYSVRADGTDLRRLTTNPGPDSWPSYTADGSRILFANPRFASGLASMAADGSDQREIPHEGVHYDSAPRMNPAGTRILFERNLPSEGIELWSMAPDGSDVRFVTSGQAADWAPDGSRITWPGGGSSGFDELWTMASDGTDPRGLYAPTSAESEVFNPAYSPDGRLVVSTRSIATLSTPGTVLPLVWVTEVANPANHRAIFPNPATPSRDLDDYGYVFDANWQPCIAAVTTSCTTAAIKLPGSGSAPAPGPGPSPLPSPSPGSGASVAPRTARAVTLARRQRGPRVKLTVRVDVVPAKLVVQAKAGRRVVARRTVRVRAAGRRRVALKLNVRGRRALKRAGTLRLKLTLRATAAGGRPATLIRNVTLRER
jgi:hypothetical protein